LLIEEQAAPRHKTCRNHRAEGLAVAPFEFMILFFAFIYTLGLTHLYFAISRMIRHRRELIFSWPHALWMAAAFINLFANWISFYDFRHFEQLSLGMLVAGTLVSMLIYFQGSLVSPDFEQGDGFDMREFHEKESPTYIGVNIVLLIVSLVVNYAASAALSVTQWGEQNGLVLLMLPPCIAAVIWRNRWVQIISPLATAGLIAAYLVKFYPVLKL
jgi:hypothetical protein